MKALFILIACFVAAAANCQSLPGLDQNTNEISASSDSGAQKNSLQPSGTPITQTASAIAEAITPDIQSLAANLEYNPTMIFNFVHDQIRYVHYFGSKKGAQLTLLERSGNDFDQCALLSALLQASGYLPTYQFAIMQIPFTSSTNNQDLQHWWGLDFSNTNWSNTTNFLGYFMGTRGFPVWYTFSDTNTIGFQRVWLKLAIGSATYYLDPAFKVSLPIAGINLSNAMSLNTNTLMATAGGTDAGYAVSGLNESSLRNALQTNNNALLSYLSNNLPNASVAQVLGGQQIVSSIGSPLATNLQFNWYTNNTYKFQNWTNQPTNFMGTFSITFAGTNQTWYTPQLEGQRLSLTFSSNGLSQLWLEDNQVLQTTNTGSTNTISVILSATHPYGGWNSSQQIPTDVASKGFDRSSTNAYQRTNASYAIMYGFDVAPQWLQARQQKLDAYLAQGLPNTSRQVTTETLNVMGLGWMTQTELAHQLLCQEWKQLPESQHRYGRMAQEQGQGYYVDVYLQLDGTLPATSYNTPDIIANHENFDVQSYFYSAMEHAMIEQLQSSNLVGASTVKMIEIAGTNSSQSVYLASSANWTAGANIKGNLVGYSSTTLSALGTLIGDGYILLLPQNGTNHVAGAGTWDGYGYVQLGTSANGRSMGMIISGGYNGGYDSNPNATINPPYVSESANLQPTFFNPQPPTLPTSIQLGADPVNMVDGSFQITSSDLTVGQTDPRGLNLTRYYSSERINSNPAGMAPGWLHSYYCNATPLSDPESGLGMATVEQMAPMIVAAYSALNLYVNNGTLTAKNWTVTALIAKWGVDQLINNAVSVCLGNQTVQFERQPNGSYTPPGNCTMTLIQTNAAFVLQERHGRTFKFNTNSLLTNIVDQYGQSMKLSYNSNNLLTNVTDWTNRTLVFTYTGGALTSVSDSTGRSVSYAYTGGELTSYTDPESKTTTYAYDTNYELIATIDGLGNLVESNYYDGLGHITTQLTAGNTNKMWQVFPSGSYTVEIDPAGDQLVYTYDTRSRLTSFQDGMGNLTQMVYDGQDHLLQTISPLNETNQFLYDGSNNLIAAIDPLGYSNTFTFDANNNLVASTDKRGKISHFGYNSQFSLIGSTNGNGDYFTLAYNANGTLQSRTDSGGTTTYAYDSGGTLNSITYPSSLGSESFVNSTLGDPTSHTDVRGFTTTYAYNNRRQLTNTVAPTNLTTKATFDPNGNLSTTTDARGYLISNSWSTTRKLLGTTLPSTPQGTPTISSTYDNRDWLASLQNPLGNTTYYTNDAAQRLIAVTDPMQRTTGSGYDNDSHQVTSTDAAGDLTTQFWNPRGDLIKVIDAANNIVGKAYDGAGNLIYLTNRNTNIWQFQYDGANRLTNTISPLSHASSQVYNNRGLLQSSTDPMNQTTTYGYDARGRITSKADAVGTINYTYDGNNNLTLLTNLSGPRLGWAYDAYNRVVGFTNAAGYVVQYRYDANGNLTNLIYPGNLTVNYYYDSNNRLTNVTDWSARQTVLGYDLAGHLTSVTRPNSTVRQMNYDNDGELTNIVDQTTGKYPICFYTLNYNAAGRVQWEFKGPLPHSNAPPTRTMTYDADNRLATFNGSSVTDDNDGRITYGPGTNNTFGTYAYDARSELTSAGGIGYGYDPSGNRTSQTNGSAVTTFVVNPQGSQVLMRITGGTTNYYIYGGGLLYEIDATSTTTTEAYYHFDCRGSAIALTDPSGNPTDLVEYTPYGTTAFRYGTNSTPFLYNAQFGVQTDPNGLLFMRARYYNPYISRFINSDPSGFGGGLNFYAFCNDNPINLEDPFGLGANNIIGLGGSYPASPFSPGGAYYVPGPIPPPGIGGYLLGGLVIGGAGAAVITFGGPLAVAGLTTVGVPAATATATVTTTIGVVGALGAGVTAGNALYNGINGNWNNVAFDFGTLGGGALFGGVGGGRFIADNVSPTLSTVPYSWNPITADAGYGFVRNPTLPFGQDVWNWLGTGPTPTSAGTTAMGISSGASLFLSLSGTSSGQSSANGK
jgi:RHS repeat-associated protein